MPLLDNRKFARDFPLRGRYLIAVSGGRDSVALLHQLVDLGYRRLTICHLNHKLRGRSSDADARFVERLAAKYDVDLAIASVDVRSFAAGKLVRFNRTSSSFAQPVAQPVAQPGKENRPGQKMLSIETAARECRYNFFARVAKQKRCRTIFLAHHADDLVETFLLNLFRGSGTTGLVAMREVATREIQHVDLTIVRPLLSVWRSDIDKYIRKHRLKFREDASNKNLSPLRNRIRHRVIPHLEKTLARNIRQNIWRTATIASEEENFFETLLPPSPNLTGQVALAAKPLREMSIALQRRTLRRWLRDANVSDIGFDLIERVRALIDSTAQVAKTNLPQDRHVRRRAGKLFIE